jgi:hypothetical protein
MEFLCDLAGECQITWEVVHHQVMGDRKEMMLRD